MPVYQIMPIAAFMRVPAFLLLVPLWLAALPAGQEHRLLWSATRKLKVTDFRRVDPAKSTDKYGARTFHKVRVDYTLGDSSMEYNIVESFDAEASWMKLYSPTGISPAQAAINDFQQGRGLRHEQGHFDLGEVYARRIRLLCRGYARINDEQRLADSIQVLL